MGNEAENKMETQEGQTLIDIFYKDTDRIDSFLAQLSQGITRSVKRQNSISGNINKSIGSDLKLLKGDYTSTNTEQKMMEYNIDQNEMNTLKLLDLLDLDILEDLPEIADSKLVHLSGHLAIRNMKTFSELIPTMAKSADLFKLSRQFANDIKKKFGIIFKMIPLTIEMEITLDNGKILRGVLEEDHLLTSYDNILATYGTVLPNKWDVIGILDKDSFHITQPKSQLRNSLDVLNQSISNIYLEGVEPFSFVPIMIYRELNK